MFLSGAASAQSYEYIGNADQTKLTDTYGITLGGFVSFPCDGMHPGFAELKYPFIHSITPGSIADHEGLKPGDVILSDVGRLPIEYMKTLPADQLPELLFGAIEKPARGLTYRARVSTVQAIGNCVSGPLSNRVVLIPSQRLVDYLGFRVNARNVVQEVVPGSDAEMAGLLVGDMFPSPTFGMDTSGLEFMEGFANYIWRHADSVSIVRVNVKRDGKTVSLDMFTSKPSF